MTRIARLLLLSLGFSATSHGEENAILHGAVETIAADDWIVSGFESTLELTSSGLSGAFRIGRLTLTESGESFDDIAVACVRIVMSSQTVRCSSATFTVTLPEIGRQKIPGSFTYHRLTGAADVHLSAVAVAGGHVRCDISTSENGIVLRYTGTGLHIDKLIELGSKYSDALTGYSASGRANVSGRLRLPANGPMRIAIQADLEEMSLANDAGTVAAESVAGQLALDVIYDAGNTTLTLEFASEQGEAYLEPVYANFSENAFRLHAEEVSTSDFVVFDVGGFEVQHGALIDAGGAASLSFPEQKGEPVGISAAVEIGDAAVEFLYTNFVQIALAGTVLGDLETDGRVSGSVRLVDSAPQSATLRLEDLILDDRQGRFAIYGLNGAVDWRADEDQVPAVSEIRWDSGTAYNIVVGGGQVRMQLGDNDVELLEPLRLPTLGGALRINQLVLRDFGTAQARGRLDAELEPVQLGQLTGAFGWPAFSGTLSGRLPLLQLEEDTITVGGTLSARAFDGAMEIADLRIEQPFGIVPRLQANVTLRNLDLQRLTEAFSFGLIQGRLSGNIAGLVMQNWRPVAMDMHFFTPTDDTSKRRISQRAVENLASVGGGGAAAALSTGFMQFFEVFAYDQIGLRCVLRDGACAMSGAGVAKAGPQGQGYYIVKGRGVPRIDVVGYRNTVSWSRLVQQVSAITRSGSPTVN